MGKAWYEDYKSQLTQKYRDQIQRPVSSSVRFTFGGGENKNSLGRYRLPLELHGCICKMVVEMVDTSIPLMLSKTSMTRAGMKLDFRELKTIVFGVVFIIVSSK